jgi:thioredoxin 1
VFNGWKGMTQEEFAKLVNSGTPTLIDFRAKWCGPCKQLKPILDEIQTTYEGKIKIVEIDIDENKSLAESMHIMHIPNLQYFKNGKIESSFEGFKEKADLLAILKLE